MHWEGKIMKLTMFIGFPGVGKSTILNRIYKDELHKPFIYSTDLALEQIASKKNISYNDAYSLYYKDAQTYMNSMLDYNIKHCRDVIWDQTNLSLKKRQKVLRRMIAAKYHTIGIYIKEPNTDEDMREWRRRLDSRPGKIIDDSMIADMRRHYTEPSLEDGFHELIVYDFNHNILSHVNAE